MAYTVKQLAQLAGVSVRTLHYYDELGLLIPRVNQDNGYRLYEHTEVVRLQQILFFRELDFSLEQIQAMLSSPHFDQLSALRDQRQLLLLEKKRLTNLLKTIDATIDQLKGTQPMNDQQMLGGFTKDQAEKYRQEIKKKYGQHATDKSDAYMKDWKQADYDRLKADMDAFHTKLVALMPKGVADAQVQTMISEHYENTNRFFDCTLPVFKELGKGYVEDPRFKAFYDKYHPELAQFMCDAMAYFADNGK
ncbi:MAG TPA: MerR family transcriptional regulator [Vitreimonas sp.]|nr:MerR family transcriptional regulator [Vitreimonas sp.]